MPFCYKRLHVVFAKIKYSRVGKLYAKFEKDFQGQTPNSLRVEDCFKRCERRPRTCKFFFRKNAGLFIHHCSVDLQIALTKSPSHGATNEFISLEITL